MITTLTRSTIETMEAIRKMGNPTIYSEFVQAKDDENPYLIVSLQERMDDKGRSYFNFILHGQDEPKESFKVREGLYRYFNGYAWYFEIDGDTYFATNY